MRSSADLGGDIPQTSMRSSADLGGDIPQTSVGKFADHSVLALPAFPTIVWVNDATCVCNAQEGVLSAGKPVP